MLKSKPNKILALDLGTTSGFAVYSSKAKSDKRFSSGFMDFSLKTTKKLKENPGVRFVKFKQFLETFEDIDLVVYEEVHRHLGTQAAHIYGGFKAFVLYWCEINGIECHSYGVKQIKKHATDNGNATKEQMIEAARVRYKHKVVENDNEADALWILDMALSGKPYEQ